MLVRSASERTLATSVVAVAPYVGVSLGYVVGPLAAPDAVADDAARAFERQRREFERRADAREREAQAAQEAHEA